MLKTVVTAVTLSLSYIHPVPAFPSLFHIFIHQIRTIFPVGPPDLTALVGLYKTKPSYVYLSKYYSLIQTIEQARIWSDAILTKQYLNNQYTFGLFPHQCDKLL